MLEGFTRRQEESALRPVDLARDAGLSVTQIRTYERLGVLPPAERTPSGHRHYGPRHLHALRTARAAMAGYGWQTAVKVLAAVHRGDLARARGLVDDAHGALAAQRARTREAMTAVDAALAAAGAEPPGPRGRRPEALRISAAARRAGVRVSALRFWEEQGLLSPDREAGTGYRRYDSGEIAKVTLIALLRTVGYRFPLITSVLDELAAGRPEQVRHALAGRLTRLDEASADCLAASAALHDYLRIWEPLVTTKCSNMTM
jgi:DNA-binding transcriptional MerR regulator